MLVQKPTHSLISKFKPLKIINIMTGLYSIFCADSSVNELSHLMY